MLPGGTGEHGARNVASSPHADSGVRHRSDLMHDGGQVEHYQGHNTTIRVCYLAAADYV